MRGCAPFALLFLLLGALQIGGALSQLDVLFENLRFSLNGRSATQEVVLVRIDPASLDRIGIWPWPRSFHAALVDRLIDAGAERLLLDIDLSSPTTPVEDEALAQVLERYGSRVHLPVYAQHAGPSGVGEIVFTAPQPAFAAAASLASATTWPDEDGRLRDTVLSRFEGGAVFPTIAAVLAGMDEPPAMSGKVRRIDFAIDPATLPQISAIDVLSGRFDAEVVDGRRIIVAATAAELGDIVAVPVWRALPGGVVQALAAESWMTGRALRPVSDAVPLAALAVLLTAVAAASHRDRHHLAIIVALSGSAAAFVGGHLAYAVAGLSVDVSSLILGGSAAAGTALAVRAARQQATLAVQAADLDRQRILLRRVQNHVFDALLTADREGIVRSANRAAELMFGVFVEQLVGLPVKRIFDPPAAPEPAHGGRDWAPLLDRLVEHVALRADGSRFDVEYAITAFDHGPERLFVIQIRDISQRNADRAAARAAEGRLQAAVESLSEGFALYDADDRLVMVNDRLSKDFACPGNVGAFRIGDPFADILGRLVDCGHFPEAKGRERLFIAERLAVRTRLPNRFEVQVKDGRWLCITEAATPEGGTVAVYRDLTAQKLRERQLEDARKSAEIANRAKSEFIAAMSHELRTPLNAVIGFSEMMRDEMLGPLGSATYRGYAGDIHSSATHLLGIINDILDLSRVEAGRLDLREETVELRDIVASTLRLLTTKAEEAGVMFEAAIADDLSPVLVDARLIKQTLCNLLSNAIRFSPQGGRIRVSAERRADGGVRLQVLDTGMGIQPEDIPRVLKPFEQADTGDTRRFDGLGLGLSLVKAFTEAHGGAFLLESVVGEGTTATVDLPSDRCRGDSGAARAAG